MEDTSQIDYEAIARSLGELIRDHKGRQVTILDLRKIQSWTDFFVIATVTSNTQQQAIARNIKEYAHIHDVPILHRQRKIATTDEWCLIDMGPIIIHLMTERLRSFYELERLWADASILWQEK